MTPTPPQELHFSLPNPSTIRTAIDAADEKARLLRQLLRVVTRLRVHFTAADHPRHHQSEGGRPND